MAGSAHSIEVWIYNHLAGGLYGVTMGQFFFGESMSSLVSDASKLALAYLFSRVFIPSGRLTVVDDFVHAARRCDYFAARFENLTRQQGVRGG